MRKGDHLYRKRGRVSRVENGTLLDIAERGVAWERDGVFFCKPEAGAHLPPVSPDRVLSVVDEIRSVSQGRADIERLIVSEGRAEHSVDERSWRESSERIHLALTRASLRVLVDLGSFELDDVRVAVDALARAEVRERTAPDRLRLAAGVSAALLPNLAAELREDVQLLQSAGGVDGFGMAIEERDTAERPWSNWFRPSYRTRPVQLPLNVRAAVAASEIDPSLPLAVALLEPPRGLTVRALVDDGTAVYPAALRLTKIRAAAVGTRWYPFGAGSFGAEMML
ncbi:MAG: hypothetical protein WA208_12045 [Thermoanaerobaculia bacterium]